MGEEPAYTHFCQLCCRAAASGKQTARELKFKIVQQGSPKLASKHSEGLSVLEMYQLNIMGCEPMRLNQVESLMLMKNLTLADIILSCTDRSLNTTNCEKYCLNYFELCV